MVLERGFELLGLAERARKTVEDEAVLDRLALGEALDDDPEHEVVGHEVASVHVALRLAPCRRAGGDGGAEQVASGDVRDAVPLGEAGGLRPFPRPLLAQQDKPRTTTHARAPA
jgi:hypothetical protein